MEATFAELVADFAPVYRRRDARAKLPVVRPRAADAAGREQLLVDP